jgi:hypothetical protein
VVRVRRAVGKKKALPPVMKKRTSTNAVRMRRPAKKGKSGRRK